MYHIKEADVVVVGAGAAGAMSAIYIHRTDPSLRIAVMDKSKTETSGAAGRGMDALNTIAIPPYSNPEDIVEMLTKVTEGVLDQEVAYTYGQMGMRVVKDLEGILGREKGDLFPVDEQGNYRLYYLHPTNKPMLLPMHGEEMKRAMGAAVRATGATVYDRTPAIRIVTENGRVAGVLGYNIRTGDFYYVKCKAVCLTTGCAGRISIHSAGYMAGMYEFPGNTGDGYRMAYEAGAELASMECFQASTKIKDHEGPACGYVASPRGAYSVNRLGERVNAHTYASGDSRLAMWREYAEGRGPVYLRIDHLPEDMINVIEKVQFGNERTTRGMFHHNRGQDYRQTKTIELALGDDLGACGGHSSSGVLGDKHGATNIPGLYVAGDVDAGLPHSYLGGAIGMGGWIGEKAAEFAQNHDRPEVDSLKPWLKKQIDAFEAPLHRAKGLPSRMVEFKARNRIRYYLTPPKNPEYFNLAIWWMQRIRNEDVPEIKAVDRRDLLRVHEIQSITLVGEMMAQASLARDESRWGYHHWRVDMPAKKTEWDRTWLIVRKGADGMEMTKRPVPPFKWDFPDFMEYEYPELSMDTGKLFKRDPNLKNPPDDPWMGIHLEKEGMKTQRRFMSDVERGE
jgi:succinate dehydrogenase/fumarate reductase flavoprotein subunit